MKSPSRTNGSQVGADFGYLVLSRTPVETAGPWCACLLLTAYLVCTTLQWRIQGGVGAAAPYLLRFFSQKRRFFLVKGIYFVLRICDK